MNDQSTETSGSLRPHPTRAVYRAVGELRRGAAILIAGDRPMVVLAAETAAASSLWEAGVVAGGAGPVRLVVSAGRAGLPEDEGLVAFTIATSFDALAQGSPLWLRDLADPTRQDPGIDFAGSFARAPLPAAAAAALAAVKLARLAPAAILVETDHAAEGRATNSGMGVAEGASFLEFAHHVAAGLEIVADASVPLEDAPNARLVAFRAPDGGIEHLAVVVGDPGSVPAPLVRVHSECFTGDFLGSLRCDCGDQLRRAIRRMSEEGAGVLLYLAQEGRGIGLVNKLRAYALQDRGLDTLDANRALGWDADERTFLTAATMLQRLGIGRIRLLTNNPDKVAALAGFGIEVAERVGHVIEANGVNDQYLATKQQRFGHLFG
jgi:GTP cyclohydrolase II